MPNTRHGSGAIPKALINDFKNIIKNPVSEAKETYDLVKDVINKRNDYPPDARQIIKDYGMKLITNITIGRTPVQKALTGIMNIVSGGDFYKKLSETPYDKLFHLFIIITLEGGKKIRVEKNEVINISTNLNKQPKEETKQVSFIPAGITLNQLLEGGKEIQGNKYFNYSAYNNNCQDFILALLKGSSIGNEQDYNFIKQDVKTLFKNNPTLRKISNTVTDIGARANVLLKGSGNNNPLHKGKKIILGIQPKQTMYEFDSDSSSDSGSDTSSDISNDDEKDIIKTMIKLKKKVKRHNKIHGGKISIAKQFNKLGKEIKQSVYKPVNKQFIKPTGKYVTSTDGLLSDVVNYGIPAASSTLLGAPAGFFGGPLAGMAASAVGAKLGTMAADKIAKETMIESRTGEGLKRRGRKPKSGSGDLIHIDIASHNAKGRKASNSMEGGYLEQSHPVPHRGLDSRMSVPSFSQTLSTKHIRSANALLDMVSDQDLKDVKNMLNSTTIENNLTSKQRKALEAKMKKEFSNNVTKAKRRFAKGSQEAKEHMVRVRAARKNK